MTFIQIVRNIFVKKPNKAKDNSANSKNKFRTFLSRLPGGFMLPISIMAVGGLFSGIGSALEANSNAELFGAFLKSLGSPIFGAMPTLFLIAIIIAFTEEAGVAVFAGIVSFIVFNSMQVPFIDAQGDGFSGTATFLGIQTSLDIQMKMYSIVGTNLGITSINSSIFGGIIVGLIVAWTYNRFHIVELPKMLSFFGGKRFVAIISVIIMIPLTFLFLLIWPWIGVAFAYFGEYSGKVSGLDSFIFGFLERATLPFGLAWPILGPLGLTSAGGDILESFSHWTGTIKAINGQDLLSDFNAENLAALKNELLSLPNIWSEQDIQAILNASGDKIGTIVAGIVDNVSREVLFENIDVISKGINYQEATSLNSVFISKIIANGTYTGDMFGWLAANNSGIKNVTYEIDGQIYTEPLFPFIEHQIGLNLGRFGTSGFIPIQQFALPAAALAMVIASPKARRKEAISIYLPAAFTSFLVGVTEPLEYTFLFLAPVLFFGFHALMEGLAFLFLNLADVHFSSTFSGLIDSLIYASVSIGKGTNFYWAYIIGVAYAPIYYLVFYWWIKHFDVKTPGRDLKIRSSLKKQAKLPNNAKLTLQEAQLIKAMGGWDNIASYTTCMTRLRYDIKNKKLVNEEALKAAGAAGVVWNGQNLQTIIGMQAEQMNANIKKAIGTNLEQILTFDQSSKEEKSKENNRSRGS